MRFSLQKIMVTFCSFSVFLCFFITEEAFAEQKEVAQVVVADGQVFSLDTSSRRELKRGSKIFENEWLEIGENSYAEILEADGTVISFLEKTKFHFTQLDADSEHPENYKNISSLTAGGLKVISGGLAKLNPGGYALKTPVATIGIRGTVFIISLIMRNNVPNLDLALTSGRLSVTQSNATFIDGSSKAPLSKKLITLLEPGDATRMTPRTARKVKLEEVFGYQQFQSAHTASVDQTQSPAPTTTHNEVNHTTSVAEGGPPPSDSSGNSGSPPAIPATEKGTIKPAADSAFCNPS